MCTGGRAGGRAGVRYVITKFSQMDSLPNFLTHGAPLCARFARARSSANVSYIALPLLWYISVRLTGTHLAIGSRLETCLWIILFSSLKLLKFIIIKGYIYKRIKKILPLGENSSSKLFSARSSRSINDI